MCFGGGRSAPAPQPLPQPPPILPRNPDILRESRLPDKKKLVDEDETPAGIQYGSSAKQGGAAAGKRVGAKALRIPLNTGTATASSSQGGLNVP